MPDGLTISKLDKLCLILLPASIDERKTRIEGRRQNNLVIELHDNQ